MIPVAMGSCYLDKGEGLEYVTEQVKRMAKTRPQDYYFDIICLPRQLQAATLLLSQFYKLVAKEIPDLAPDHIYAGITCNEMIRPAAMALVVASQDSDVGIVDLNPERRPR
jgi:hypothetical protein